MPIFPFSNQEKEFVWWILLTTTQISKEYFLLSPCISGERQSVWKVLRLSAQKVQIMSSPVHLCRMFKFSSSHNFVMPTAELKPKQSCLGNRNVKQKHCTNVRFWQPFHLVNLEPANETSDALKISKGSSKISWNVSRTRQPFVQFAHKFRSWEQQTHVKPRTRNKPKIMQTLNENDIFVRVQGRHPYLSLFSFWVNRSDKNMSVSNHKNESVGWNQHHITKYFISSVSQTRNAVPCSSQLTLVDWHTSLEEEEQEWRDSCNFLMHNETFSRQNNGRKFSARN